MADSMIMLLQAASAQAQMVLAEDLVRKDKHQTVELRMAHRRVVNFPRVQGLALDRN
jgi:hypothetical protein